MTQARSLRRLVLGWGAAGSWLGVLAVTFAFFESDAARAAFVIAATVGVFLLGGLATASTAARGRSAKDETRLVALWFAASLLATVSSWALGSWFERSQVGSVASFGLAGVALGAGVGASFGALATGLVVDRGDEARWLHAIVGSVVAGVGFLVACWIGAIAMAYLATAGSRLLTFPSATFGGVVGAAMGGFFGGALAGASLGPSTRAGTSPRRGSPG